MPAWAADCAAYRDDLRAACLVRLLDSPDVSVPQLTERCAQVQHLAVVHDQCLSALSLQQAPADLDIALESCAAIEDRVWREECRLRAADQRAAVDSPAVAMRSCARHVRHFTSHCISHAQQAWAQRQGGDDAWFTQDALLDQLRATREATPLTQRFLLAPWFGGLLHGLDPAAQADHCAALFYGAEADSCSSQTQATPMPQRWEGQPWW